MINTELREPGTTSVEHDILGWPHETACIHCGKPSAALFTTYEKAAYECRGNPTHPKSAYGPARCGMVFDVVRAEVGPPTLADFTVGQRVELHPSTDLWMMGARYGEVVKVGRKYVHVKLDRGTDWVITSLPRHLMPIKERS